LRTILGLPNLAQRTTMWRGYIKDECAFRMEMDSAMRLTSLARMAHKRIVFRVESWSL
jgi:hypothetical protein